MHATVLAAGALIAAVSPNRFRDSASDSAGPADGLMALFNNLPSSVEFAEITIVQNRGHDAGHEAHGVLPCYVFTKEDGKITARYCHP